ncbi:solute carrier family 22 member 5-like isoform X1 [Scleropages formosus]|uniref:Solute carrier family 22 member 5-like n=1 Tax=Scleropages formosus TaxID=113540 RepID=A0A8C9SAJ7_SCLFO|nr:solute carrier family 22 member 5-like isoform X1 [Scleropages formosus]
MEKKMRNFEEITLFLGEWGSFQRSIFFWLSVTFVPHGYMSLAMVFLSATPQHHCTLPPHADGSVHAAVPYELVHGKRVLSRCTRYQTANRSTESFWNWNETEGCLDGWTFSTDRYTSTAVTEWSLVCEDAWKAPFASSVLFCGVMVGSLLSGQVSDRFGRKLVFFISLALQNVLSLLQALSSTWELYCIFYFFEGMAQISSYMSAFVLGSELLGKSTRVLFSSLGVCISYALGYAFLPLFAFFIRDWRMLLVALTLPGFLCLPLWWLIPESPRWLLSQGRAKEAEAIIQEAARKNGIVAPEVIFKTSDFSDPQRDNEKDPSTSYTFVDLVKTANIRNITVFNMIIWIVTSMTYYGLSLNTPNLNGDPYLNCFISAATEIVAYVATWLFMRFTPRRFTLVFLLLLSGAMLLVIKFIPDEPDTLTVALAMLGKTGITAAYCFIYVYSTELFPTVLRNTGLGAISMAARVGTIVSPYIAYIGGTKMHQLVTVFSIKYGYSAASSIISLLLGEYNKMAPYFIMGGLSVFVGLLSLLLPETKDKELPERINQVKPLGLQVFGRASGCDPTRGSPCGDGIGVLM